jgi:hypothetical protein
MAGIPERAPSQLVSLKPSQSGGVAGGRCGAVTFRQVLLLWWVFGADPLRCPKCALVMRCHAVVRCAWVRLMATRNEAAQRQQPVAHLCPSVPTPARHCPPSTALGTLERRLSNPDGSHSPPPSNHFCPCSTASSSSGQPCWRADEARPLRPKGTSTPGSGRCPQGGARAPRPLRLPPAAGGHPPSAMPHMWEDEPVHYPGAGGGRALIGRPDW